MKKRILALLLVLALLLSVIPAALADESSFTRSRSYTDGQFTDVQSADWFSGDVKNAYELGLMQGTGEKTFSPNGTVTLAETVAVAARIHAIASSADVRFTQGTPWYQVYVDYALANGILPAALADYTRAATRLEFAQILAKALPESALAGINAIADGAIPDVADNAPVYLLYRAGVLTGSDAAGTFHPDSSIRRSEMAAIVARMADPTLRKTLTLAASGTSSAATSGSASAPIPAIPDDTQTGGGQNTALTQPFDLENPELFASGEVQYSGEQILIKFASGYSGALSDGLSAAGITALEHLMHVSSGEWYVGYTSGDVTVVMPKVRALPEVLVAEYDYVYETSSDTILDADCVRDECSGNTGISDAWYLLTGQLQDAWDYLSRLTDYSGFFGGSSSVVVAVIDTGVDYTHEDLKDNIWCNTDEIPDNGIDDDGNGYVDDYYGVNLETGRGSGMDDNGHGTHVAGIIAGANNNLGILGVAPYVKIMPIKAGMASGYFNQSQIAKAVNYAFENGADVINMSFGGAAVTVAVQDALETAYSRCVLVASAGNDGSPNENTDFYPAAPTYPAALPYVLGVMSVDMYGREASYSNWDVTAYNGVEYEVYAPGTNILSTLPGNQYASWSGTSMAAPYVSAVAALVRSAYPDREQYPTKFIYGQIAATGTRSAICCDPTLHTVDGKPHNLPKIVNVYRALTELPKPDVNVSDYTLFDLAKYGDENNGDGVIDAGETIALGFTLRNRWGKADEATVTVSCNSPYVSFEQSSIDYGSVGTYSTQDCGLVKDGEYITDLKNPFLMHVSKDCPNDYILTLSVSVTYKNGLDATDKTLYSPGKPVTFDLDVRRGVILPDLITEDMTLTAENYYIIPNATEIAKGATVTVQPGTQIQFWSDDPNDPYADTYIAYLAVKGRLLFEGTEEEHIRLFPSDQMTQYVVQIYEDGDGYVSMKYTDVVNPYFYKNTSEPCISYAYGCEFTQNHNDRLLCYRTLTSGGKVEAHNPEAHLYIAKAENCAFYRLGYSTYRNNFYCLRGNYRNCVFVDSQLNLSPYSNYIVSYENCIFYGNRIATTGNGSSLCTIPVLPTNITVENISYQSSTGTTTVTFSCNKDRRISYSNFSMQYDAILNRFAAYLGGTVSNVEGYYEYLRITVDIPNSAITDILLDSDTITIDTDMTYQLRPTVQPAETANALLLRYKSLNTDVVTVSETGLVTPVAAGTATVRIYAPDESVWRDVTVRVADRVDLTAIVPASPSLRLKVGQTQTLTYTLTPADTTRLGVSFSSSDESVVRVDETGRLTAAAPGTATITLRSEAVPAISAEVAVTVIEPVTALTFADPLYFTTLASEESVPAPTFTPADATDKTLVWESSNPEVCYVDGETGRLVKQKAGTATLRATANGSETGKAVYAELTVSVTEGNIPKITRVKRANTAFYFAFFDDGSVWYWGSGVKTPEQVAPAGSGVIDATSGYCLYEDGRLLYTPSNTVCMTNVRSIVEGWALKNDGSVWSYSGTQLLGVEHVKQIVYFHSKLLMLTESGDVYQYFNTDLTLLYSGVLSLLDGGYYCCYLEFEDRYLSCDYSGMSDTPIFKTHEKQFFANSINNVTRDFYIENGIVYAKGYSDRGELGLGSTGNFDSYTAIPGITNAETMLVSQQISGVQTFILTTDGRLYATGYNKNYELGDTTNTDRTSPVRVMIGMAENEDAFALTGSSVDESGILSTQTLALDFNEALSHSGYFNSIKLTDAAGGAVSLGQAETRLDKLIVTAAAGFEDGETYTLTVPASAVQTRLGITNEKIVLTFTYRATDEEKLAAQSGEGGIAVMALLPSGAETDDALVAARTWTEEKLLARWEEFCGKGYNTNFYHNAILNRFTDTNVEHWLRIQAPSGSSEDVYGIGGNYWGTSGMSEKNAASAIDRQIIDNRDFKSLARLNEGEILSEIPEDVWPCITRVGLLNESGEPVTTVGNEKLTFFVEFNRDMDTAIPLTVSFGSSQPYADYTVSGRYVSARRWEGEMTLSTLIESGTQYWSVSNGRSAEGHWKLYRDWGRFSFVIDTTSALAMVMQGSGQDDGVHLSWYQDEFETLAGYNVYRATSENGQYARLNRNLIPAGTTTWVDTGVIPGEVYYYNFEVVKTDLSTSYTSPKISVQAKDTMAPSLYHEPVYSAFTGSNLVLTATATDNVAIANASVFYRTAGETTFREMRMEKLNDRYSAIIGANLLMTEGLEYYIRAFDGINYTYKGSAAEPYIITISEAIDANALGDVNGDGRISILDALLILQQLNGLYNMTPEEFARADLNGDGSISAAEALRIVQYANGMIGSVRMTSEGGAA